MSRRRSVSALLARGAQAARLLVLVTAALAGGCRPAPVSRPAPPDAGLRAHAPARELACEDGGAAAGSLDLADAGAPLAVPAPGPVDAGASVTADAGASATVDAGASAGEVSRAPACASPIPLFEAGREVGEVCPDDAPRQGLTVVDLSDDWAPLALRDADDPAAPRQPYRAVYVALANEEFPAGPAGDRPRRDRFLELYGIAPSFRVLAARLLDEERHRCHARVDQAALQALTRSVQLSSPPPVTPSVRSALDVLQQLLACEGLLPASPRRLPRWRLQEALEAFQREHAIVGRGLLDRETRGALGEDGRELAFRDLLRSLRARVVDASGVIEDGTAIGARGTILSRRVDGDAFHAEDGHDPEPGGAGDLVSAAAEAAAVALGWTDPAAAGEFFRARGPAGTRRLKVALRLPPAPGYHSPEMDLRVEIDRGDVWYELPARRGRITRRPTLTLYARTSAGDEIALVRWPTTIGGWKKEVTPSGRLGLRYKNSDVGTRVWRDLVVSPAWLPPRQTPARALVRRADGRSGWLPDADLLGPGYTSAYGLVMLVHHRPVEGAEGTIWYDNGIRTHGSVSYQSILRGDSHGCHRLFNQAALQLASFLLQHRRAVRHGVVSRPFTHEFTWRGTTWKLPIAHRGYRFELTPPVQVDVLPGTLRGKVREVPHRFVRLQRPRPQVAPGGLPGPDAAAEPLAHAAAAPAPAAAVSPQDVPPAPEPR